MGFYINPREGTKEDWLLRNGQEIVRPDWPPPEGQVIVCMVDNGPFRAAGICYDMAEFSEFAAPAATPEEIEAARQHFEARGMSFQFLDSGIQRPRKWYLVPREKILEICPSVEDALA